MKSNEVFVLGDKSLGLEVLRRAFFAPVRCALAPEAVERVQASHENLLQIIAQDKSSYGINTGFGLLARTRISEDELELLQRNLILSHAVGVGKPLSDGVVRLILLMKAYSLARGFSGVRVAVVELLLALLNHDILPIIPEKGSVGASGDLAPLSHMTLALLGEGEVVHQGVRKLAKVALQEAGLAPLTLAAKEGLALINGTQVSTALALQGLFLAERLYASAVVVGALSVDAVRGNRSPFDARVHEVRGHQGQILAAAHYRKLLQGSEILKAEEEGKVRVQDPYCLRCQPQVMGAVWTWMDHARQVLLVEANAVTDNPLVFKDDSGVGAFAISGGNFHAEPVALASDSLALAINEIGNMSERRVAFLIDSNLSLLPSFLVENAGVNSGFMIAHVTAAALASENKGLAHPASVDNIPTSANQEDHVSMATYAARRLRDMVENSANIVGIEYLAACQGIDFQAPLKTSSVLQEAHALLRAGVAFYDKDRLFAPDIAYACDLVLSAKLATLLDGLA